MSVGYYCYLVTERNKLNRLRQRQYRRLYKSINKVHRNYRSTVDTVRFTLENTDYMKVNLDFRDAIVKKMEENHKLLRKAGAVCGLKPVYDGANKIYNLVTNVKPKAEDWDEKRTWHDEKFIEKYYNDYLAECQLLGITIENPYAMEILP